MKFKTFAILIILCLLFPNIVFASNNSSFALIPEVTAGLKNILFIYLAGLLTALFLLYSELTIKDNKKDKNNYKYRLISIFSIGLITRLFISVIFEGHPIDMGCFKGWASSAVKGLSNFYTNGGFVDYPPLYIYVLYFVERVRLLLFQTSPFWVNTLILKLPSIIADIACSYIIFKFTFERKSYKTALTISFIYLFNPVTILISSMWGQVDGLFVLLLALATISLYRKRYLQSSVWYALSVLFKPQGIIFLPVIFFMLVKEKDIKVILKCLGAGLAAFIVPIIPFTGNQRYDWIVKLYFTTATSYKGASLNAYNLFALLGANWKDDTEKLFIFSYGTWGFIFIFLITIITAWYILTSKSPSVPAFASAVIISGVYVLSSKMHERYIFPVIFLLLLAFSISGNRKLLVLHAGFTVTAFLNILQVFTMSQNNLYWVPANDPVLKAVSLANVLLLLFSFYIMLKDRSTNATSKIAPLDNNKLQRKGCK